MEHFWDALESLVHGSKLVIDRPSGSAHPRYPNLVYPLDYGYLPATSSMDGDGIDVWRGSESTLRVDGIICTVDLVKRDSEIKILLGCTESEMNSALLFHNNSAFMKGILVKRGRQDGISNTETQSFA